MFLKIIFFFKIRSSGKRKKEKEKVFSVAEFVKCVPKIENYLMWEVGSGGRWGLLIWGGWVQKKIEKRSNNGWEYTSLFIIMLLFFHKLTQIHGIMMDWALHNCGAGPWHAMSESYKVQTFLNPFFSWWVGWGCSDFWGKKRNY